MAPIDNVDNKHYERYHEELVSFIYSGCCPICNTNKLVIIIDEGHHIDADRFHIFKYFCRRNRCKKLFIRVDFLHYDDDDESKKLMIYTNQYEFRSDLDLNRMWSNLKSMPASMEQMD